MNMAPIPLLTQNPLADASHDVRAPGGYEWWYFDAEDPATDTQIVAIFLHGFVFHPGYLRAYFRFRERPTHLKPPVPDDFPCAYFVVYRGGKIIAQFMTQHPAARYSASRDDVAVRIGENHLSRSAGGLDLHVEGPPWALTWQGPKTRLDQKLAADLRFEPMFDHPPEERQFLSRRMTGAEHHWVIANPACRVSGAIDLPGGERIAFTGRGYHDHNYGSGPLGPGLSWWFWGRAIADDRVITFHYAVPKAASLQAESHVVIADAAGLAESQVSPTFSAERQTAMLLRYPEEARWGDLLKISRPRVIDSAPFYLRLLYEAQVGAVRTTAFCELAYPHRLRWPILGRMIETSISRA